MSPDILHNLLKIDSTLVFDDCFRVNVWTQVLQADRVVPTSKIAASFLLECVDNEVIDRTLRGAPL